MDYNKVKDHFSEDWAIKLKPFIEGKDFDDIFAFLKKESKEGKTICPEYINTFRAFKETPYKDLRVIFILQDPYPWIKNGKMAANGVPMDCSNTGVCQPSLDLFYDGISNDIGEEVPHNPSLKYLCDQGVLFLNTSLTVEVNKPSSHKGVWDKFNDYLINEVINFYNKGLIYVCLGRNAELAAKAVVPFLHWGIEVEHPAAAAHKNRKWDHQKLFTQINKVLKDSNEEKIIWNYDTYTKNLHTEGS